MTCNSVDINLNRCHETPKALITTEKGTEIALCDKCLAQAMEMGIVKSARGME